MSQHSAEETKKNDAKEIKKDDAEEIKFERQRFEQRCMEEYKALRAESIRCAGIISNTVWIGIAQFALTIAAAIASGKDSSGARLVFLILLSLESIAATSMYLSELWKYVRIGRYIRGKVESQYERIQGFNGKNIKAFDHENVPMFWEHWINSRVAGRSKSFTLVSLFILQIPIIVCVATIVEYFFPPVDIFFPELAFLVSDNILPWRSLLLLITIVAIDLSIVFRLLWKIKGDSERGLFFDK
jgi:hypothetical protein